MDTTRSEMPGYEESSQALEKLGSVMGLSETQGVLCGLLLDNQGMVDWLKAILDDLPDSGDVLAKEQLLILKDVFEQSREQLNAGDMGLNLLLPDEQEEFSERLTGLAAWCQGFLYGYALTPKSRRDEQPEAVSDCLNDLLEISQLDVHSDHDEEAEMQFVELEEYVRMSVIFLNEELNPVQDAPQIQ